ncbi:MAG: YfiR family protein [Steroidobacter sp.]|nr:YfiR family protein [Steroidobacter sp.]
MIRFLQIVSALVSLSLATASALADASAQREDQFKAAYVFNFVKFVEWPADSVADTLTVCFVGGEGVYSAFTSDIGNKKVGTRRLAALQVIDPPPPGTCHALYIHASMASSYELAPEPAVLTISDAASLAATDGMIGLFTENQRLRFSIDMQQATRAGLRISSQLLKLAAIVKRQST